MKCSEVLLTLGLAAGTLVGIIFFIHFLFPNITIGIKEENYDDHKPLWNRIENERTIKDLVFRSRVAEDTQPMAIRKHGYPLWMSEHGKGLWFSNNKKELTNIGEEIYLRLKIMEVTMGNEIGKEIKDKMCIGIPFILPNQCTMLEEIVHSAIGKKNKQAAHHQAELAPTWLSHRYQDFWKARKLSVHELRNMLGATIRKINAIKHQ